MKSKSDIYDAIIVGAGISGTAMAYVLSKYSNVKKILLIEKYGKVAQVNSNTHNNSQTLHFGDIETNYSFEKAKKVKRAAEMVKNYIEKNDGKRETFSKYHKMVIAVGDEQAKRLSQRYTKFKKLFPELKKIDKKEISRLEPEVVNGRNPDEALQALFSENGYAVDYQKLAESFIGKFLEKKNRGKDVELFLGTKVNKIKESGSDFLVETNKGNFYTKTVAVESGAHSLNFAKSMGHGLKYALLTIAGNFYFAPSKLNGKVYTMQVDKLPFAAIHGDPEVHDKNKVRFGPTAKTLLMLERRKYGTVYEYFRTIGLKFRTIESFFKILFSDIVIFHYMIRNLFYDIPFIGKRMFLDEVRKIVPSIKLSELKFARGYGGVRPQIVNTETKKLEMGEAKIIGKKIVFNITPSPGASTCLRNAEDDAKFIVKSLGKKYKFAQKQFDEDLTIRRLEKRPQG